MESKEHVDDKKLVNEAHRIVKPGGLTLIASVLKARKK